jgi:hypothetical protein
MVEFPLSCSVDGCAKPSRGQHGKCKIHRKEQLDFEFEDSICLIAGCENKPSRRNAKYCGKTCRQIAARVKEYDLTLEDYNNQLTSQHFKCCICKRDNGSKSLYIDHDHKTGLIRGLICHGCNSSLGYADDNIETLKNMIDYLERARIVNDFTKELNDFSQAFYAKRKVNK